jgi:chemotaxis protein methyltransferase CheR
MSLTPTEFGYVQQLVRDESAISLSPGKEYLVEARLAPLAEREGLSSVAALIDRLPGASAALRHDVVQAMTTNETSFFRDVHPFEALRETVLPAAVAANGGRRLRLWSAAASTGQEAYSLAMLVAEHFAHVPDVTILGTDLSRDVLARAAAGRFTQLEVNRGLPAAKLVRWFERSGAEYHVKDELRRRVEFRELNLSRPWPPLPQMDVVLLRNLLIYFDLPAKQQVLAQVSRVLAPGGVLFLGGAETTYGLDDGWERVQVGRTSFYRPARAGGPP